VTWSFPTLTSFSLVQAQLGKSAVEGDFACRGISGSGFDKGALYSLVVVSKIALRQQLGSVRSAYLTDPW
jgi:hypothetical protein